MIVVEVVVMLFVVVVRLVTGYVGVYHSYVLVDFIQVVWVVAFKWVNRLKVCMYACVVCVCICLCLCLWVCEWVMCVSANVCVYVCLSV